jgi:hypothetical protein
MFRYNTISVLQKIALFFVFLLLATYYKRNPTGDDAWFGEQAYWWWKDGHIRSEFFHGLLRWDEQLYVAHKLFLLFGVILLAIFGVSSYHLQVFGFLSLCFLLFGFYLYYRKQDNSLAFCWILVLVFANSLLGAMSFEYRPEIMLAALGFMSFYFLTLAQNTTNHSNTVVRKNYDKNAVFAAIFAGLALLTHLNGVIYIFAGFLYLAMQRKYVLAIVFGAVASTISAFYFIDVALNNAWAEWLFQFRNDPATVNAFGIAAKVKVMLLFPKIFVESPEQLVSVVLLSSLLFIYWKEKNLQKSPALQYLFCLILPFWLITKSTSGIYQVMFLPFIFIVIANILSTYTPKTHFKYNFIPAMFIILYLLVGIIGNSQRIINNFRSDFMPDYYDKIASQIPKNSRVIVPMTFFFNQYPNYQLISHTVYGIQYKNTLTASDFFALAEKENYNFVLLSQVESYLHYPSLTQKKCGNFVCVYEVGNLRLFQKQ